MIRKVLGFGLIVALCLFGLYRIRLSLQSPGERLRYRMAELVSDFNRGRVRDVIAGFAPEFRDEASGAKKEDVLSALQALWFDNRDTHGKYLLEFQWLQPFEPTLDEASEHAKASIEFQIVDHHVDPPRVIWKSLAELEFTYQGGAWRLVKTSDVDPKAFGRD
ncbi:MAG TPA: hypothetical protein P5218_16235 [Planctomycetota bacterium]|nr:hypothetical protein [Planctomycetota bacterium]